MLTESELQLIRDEAEKEYPIQNVSAPNSRSDYFPYDVNYDKRNEWIKIITKERERTKKNIEQAIVDEWKDKFGEMDKELDVVGIYFITGFVSSAIERLSNYQNKTP